MITYFYSLYGIAKYPRVASIQQIKQYNKSNVPQVASSSFKLASHIVVPCATMKHHGATDILIGQSPAIKIHFTVL